MDGAKVMYVIPVLGVTMPREMYFSFQRTEALPASTRHSSLHVDDASVCEMMNFKRDGQHGLRKEGGDLDADLGITH